MCKTVYKWMIRNCKKNIAMWTGFQDSAEESITEISNWLKTDNIEDAFWIEYLKTLKKDRSDSGKYIRNEKARIKEFELLMETALDGCVAK